MYPSTNVTILLVVVSCSACLTLDGHQCNTDTSLLCGGTTVSGGTSGGTTLYMIHLPAVYCHTILNVNTITPDAAGSGHQA